MTAYTDDDVTAALLCSLPLCRDCLAEPGEWCVNDYGAFTEEWVHAERLGPHPYPLGIVAAVAPAIAARALREAADDADEFRTFTYGEGMFVRPTKDEYAAINDVLKREFGHGTDRIAADCMDRAIAVQAERLRTRAERMTEHPDAEFLAHHPEWKV